MNDEHFWQVVGAAGSHDADLDLRNEALTARLDQLDDAGRAEFGRIYDALDRAAYRWDLWGAAYQINGGCSDDGFDYFRAWLISQGRTIYEAALANPDSLADHIDHSGDEHENEDFLHLAREALGEAQLPPFPTEPAGEDWDFDNEAEMQRRYPRICGRGESERVTLREVLPVFSSLGYRIPPDADQIGRLLESAAVVSKRLPAAQGEVLLESGDHHRLWQNLSLAGSQPILECGGEPGMSAFSKQFSPDRLTKVWVVDHDDPGHSDPYQLGLETPHSLFGTMPPVNELCPLSLTMLANECLLFDSVEALAADPRTEGWPVPEFAPLGLFNSDGNESAEPNNNAFLTGTILRSIKAENSICSSKFWALRVKIKHGEAWICLPIEALDQDPTGQVIAATGRMTGSFSQSLPDLSSPEPQDSSPGFDNEAVEDRIRELTLAFMRSEEFTPMFSEIHPGKLEQGLVKGIGLFNKNVREIGKNFAERRCLASPELRQRYLQMAETAPIVFAHIVMANTAAIEQGKGSPALVALAWGDSGMEVMARARETLSMVHFDMHENERERELAALIEDEEYHFGRRRSLPGWLVGDQEAYAADLWVSNQALDNERLRMEVMICFAEPGPQGLTMAIPGRFIMQAIDECRPRSSPPPLPPKAGPPPLPPT